MVSCSGLHLLNLVSDLGSAGWRGHEAVSIRRPERASVVFSNSFVTILGEFPMGILAVMLLFSGMELAMASRDMGSKEESFMILVYASVLLTGSSAVLGFIEGVVLHLLLHLREV
ncbi:hypothetical protein ZWY2020_023648 [Hordeum vulgare]|nr:hypothetical protein ZWY2020_023648 [Hordeum vulgare]